MSASGRFGLSDFRSHRRSRTARRGGLPTGCFCAHTEESCRWKGARMKLLLAGLLAVQPTGSGCAASLKLTGAGERAAHHVRPYVDCLNSTPGTLEQLQAACSTLRAKATAHRGSRTFNAQVDRAVRWLDAMVRERASCETHLDVGA
jgi:hypothetical protein